MGAEETLERYELWSASAQEDSTESVDSTDKETVKDNGLEEATESGSTDSSGGEDRFTAPRSQCRQNGHSLPRRLFHQRSRLNWSRFLAARYWRNIRKIRQVALYPSYWESAAPVYRRKRPGGQTGQSPVQNIRDRASEDNILKSSRAWNKRGMQFP